MSDHLLHFKRSLANVGDLFSLQVYNHSHPDEWIPFRVLFENKDKHKTEHNQYLTKYFRNKGVFLYLGDSKVFFKMNFCKFLDLEKNIVFYALEDRSTFLRYLEKIS